MIAVLRWPMKMESVLLMLSSTCDSATIVPYVREGDRMLDASSCVTVWAVCAAPMLRGGIAEEPAIVHTLGSFQTEKQSRIQQLYRVPEEIMFFGTYDEVRGHMHCIDALFLSI